MRTGFFLNVVVSHGSSCWKTRLIILCIQETGFRLVKGSLDQGSATCFALRSGPQQNNECLAHANLLQLVTHHDTDAVRDMGLLCCNNVLRPVGIMSFSPSQWHPQRVPYVSRSSHFWTNLALVPHGPVTISSRTGTGPRTGVYRRLA